VSMFDPAMRHGPRYEPVDYIVPERIREACIFRRLTYKEAARKCGLDEMEFGLMANGQKEIPDDMIFNLMMGLAFPSDFFRRLKWERV